MAPVGDWINLHQQVAIQAHGCNPTNQWFDVPVVKMLIFPRIVTLLGLEQEIARLVKITLLPFQDEDV